MSWTPDKVGLLTKLRADGHSFSQISKRVGMSRNSCVSKADRLGLPKIDPARPVKKPAKNGLRFWGEVDPSDPAHDVDTRDLAILDELANGRAPNAVAKQFKLPESYVRELWRVRETQDAGGEVAA